MLLAEITSSLIHILLKFISRGSTDNKSKFNLIVLVNGLALMWLISIIWTTVDQ